MATVISSLHTADEFYCVDVVQRQDGYVLCTCRRDEGRWQVMEWHERPVHTSRESALAAAATLLETLG